MSKVEQVIEAYLEATGLNPQEVKATERTVRDGPKTKGGKKLTKALKGDEKNQDKNAASAARKIEQQTRTA